MKFTLIFDILGHASKFGTVQTSMGTNRSKVFVQLGNHLRVKKRAWLAAYRTVD